MRRTLEFQASNKSHRESLLSAPRSFCSRRMTSRVVSLVILLVSLLPNVASGKDALRINVSTPNNGRVRSHAGLPIQIEVDWKDERLLEGYVEITFRYSSSNGMYPSETFYTYRTPELALSFGKRNLSALLPTARVRKSNGLLTYSLKFVAPDRTIDFGNANTLIAPSLAKPRLLIGVVLGDTLVPEERTHFVEVLKFDSVLRIPTKSNDIPLIAGTVNPPKGRLDHSLSELMTQTQRIDVRDLEKSAERLCVYDLLIIADGAFARVSEKQLDALSTWIEAGGCALIEVTGNGYSRGHLEFFNGLSSTDGSAEASFLRTERGGIEMLLDGRSDPVWNNVAAGFSSGLGRVVVANQPLNDVFNSAKGSQRFVASVGEYLWNRRQVALLQRVDESNGFVNLTTLSSALTPANVQSVPASRVIVMLVIFLLAISVGDYFLLGLIGKRMWTWVLFPLISLGFTGYTVYMARHYVGSSDFTSAITIIDTSPDNRILRTNRIEMLFTAAERTSEMPLRNSTFARLSGELMPPMPSKLSEVNNWGTGRNPTVQSSPVVHAPPVCIGSVPGSYKIERQMRKWTPQISRYMTLGAKTENPVPEFSWGVEDWSSWQFESWSDKLLEEFPAAQVAVIAPGNSTVPKVGGAMIDELAKKRWASVWSVVGHVSVNKKQFVHHFSSRIAPHGGCYLNDIPTIDSTNTSGQFAVVVIIPRGEEFNVFRVTHFGSY